MMMDFADQPLNNSTIAGIKQQPLSYEQFVVVDEAEWKLHCPAREMCTHFATHLGGFEWQCNFMFQSKLRLECKELKDGTRTGQVLLELHLYSRRHETEQFRLCNNGGQNPQRVLLTPDISHWSYRLDCAHAWEPYLGRGRGRGGGYGAYIRGGGSSGWNPSGGGGNGFDDAGDSGGESPHNNTMHGPNRYVLITARILKDREQFPNFTLEKPIGHLAPNCKLAVGKTTFHVNKQWLAAQSPYFDRMFNPAANGGRAAGFVETKQDVIETGETDAAAYHDFLLAICTTIKDDVLPNRQNLAQLFHLAHYYEVVSLGTKLQRTLKLCREMGKEERLELANKYCDTELLASIMMQDVHTMEDAKRLCVALITSGGGGAGEEGPSGSQATKK